MDSPSHRTTRTLDAVLAVFLMAASVGLWHEGERFPGTAGIFPRAILAVLGTLAAVLLIQTRHRSSARGTHHDDAAGGRAMLRPLGTFAAAVGAVWLMRALGFFPAMIVFSGVLLLLLAVSRRRLYFLTIAVVLVFVYVVFAILLGVPLPGLPMAES